MKTFSKYIVGFLFTTFILYSYGCKKEIDNWKDKPAKTVYDTVSNLAFNRIISYKVVNTGKDTIFSSINDQDKTITVYLPAYYTLSFLETKISVPQEASIKPGADALVPVFSDTPFQYTVTGKDKKTASYIVSVIIQQPKFTLQEFSTADNTVTLDPAMAVIDVAGEDMLPNYDVTKIYLVDKAGKRVYSNFNRTNDAYSTKMSWFWGSDITGSSAISANTDYWVEIQSYSITARMKYPIRIAK